MLIPASVRKAENDISVTDLLPPSLTSLLGFQLRMAQITLSRHFATAMREVNLTQRQIAVLEILEWSPGASQVDIAACLATDRCTMTAIIDRLEERHLLVRRPSRTDRRRQDLHLTTEGVESIRRAREIIDQHEKYFLERLLPKERDVLFQALRRMWD